MGRGIKSERLHAAIPLLMPSTITFYKLNLQKLYAKARRLNIAQWNDALDYADFIHALWNTMLTHDALKEDAQQLEAILDTGDAIELLSEVVMNHRRQKLLEG